MQGNPLRLLKATAGASTRTAKLPPLCTPRGLRAENTPVSECRSAMTNDEERQACTFW
jgi:hypothetical protein